jgi:MFS family permease
MNAAVRSRLTWLLFFGRSLSSAGFIAGATIATIVAKQLTGQAALAGVPGALYLLGSAAAAYPAARLMDRAGRRTGLSLGFVIGAAGAIVAGLAVVAHSFAGFLLGYTLMGASQGCNDLGRYAAAEMHPLAERARAISLVVLGGTVGAIAGPALVDPMGRLAAFLQRDPLSGPWFASAVLLALGLVLVFFFLRPDPRDLGRKLDAAHAGTQAEAESGGVRPFRAILRQPATQVAVLAMSLGQLVMVMVMAITSLHMKDHGHGLGEISLVIMAHTLGMFGLSVVAGRLADKIGRAPVIVAGSGLLIAACLLAPLVHNTYLLAAALFLLGLGWNFCYVAGGALLTDTLTVAERGRMQGSSDVIIALVSAAGNLGSGLIFAATSYTLLAWVSLLISLVPLAFAFNLMVSRGRAPAAESSGN